MKRLLACILAALMLLALVACGNGEDTEQAGTETTQGTTDETAQLQEFLVTVVYPDGTETDFVYKSAEEFIGPALRQEELIKTAEKDSELIVTEVDGVKIEDDAQAKWVVYEGEYLAEQDVDTTRLVDGKIYKIVYTTVE